MMTEIYFPHAKLGAVGVMFHPQNADVSGGVSVTGDEQIVQSSAGRWSATLSFEVGYGVGRSTDAASRDPDSVLCWRAILALLKGRANTLLIGPYDKSNAPAGVEGTSYGGQVVHSDATDFSDGTEYQQAETPATLAAAIAVGATTVYVQMTVGHMPEPGQYFSILERLFWIETAEETAIANKWELAVWPPARDAITAGQVEDGLAVEFDEPRAKMRMAQTTSGQLTLRARYRSSPSLDLVEA